jgi:hypothetical protein
MKIGLISINMYSKGLNFASPIHTFVFQQFLLQHGIETTIIDYKPVYYDNFDLEHPADYYKAKIEKIEKSGVNDAKTEKQYEKYQRKLKAYEAVYKEREIRYHKFQDFIDQNYIKTDKCYDSDLLEIEDPGFDCYICATDVIWKHTPNNGFDRGFFLGSKAMENKWKIAYSASRGANYSKNNKQTTEFMYYVEDIDFVSVREKSLKEYIESNSEKKATVVLDPVFLMDESFYIKMSAKPPEEHYILLYYVMESANDTVENAVAYAREHNMKIIELTDQPNSQVLAEYDDIEYVNRYAIGIEDWLGYMIHADVIFTNSFHACCFSVIFHKKFFAGTRSGDKVDNILNTFDLSWRRVTTYQEVQAIDGREIDYNAVDKILKEKREESTDFILDKIHYCETHERQHREYEWWKRSVKYRMIYNGGTDKENTYTFQYNDDDGYIAVGGNAHEFHKNEEMTNNGYERFDTNNFIYPWHKPAGWHMRFRIDRRWFYYLENGTFVLRSKYDQEHDGPKRIFHENDRIPYIPVNNIEVMVCEAVWEEDPDFSEEELQESIKAAKQSSQKKLSGKLKRAVKRVLNR